MKVIISTAGRFHLFALARELSRDGHLEKIFTGFPWRAVAREQVPRGQVTTFPVIRPLLFSERVLPFRLSREVRDLIHTASLVAQDAYVSRVLPKCDVFVGHEGVGLYTGAAARKKGIPYVCDVGCSHVRHSHNLLVEESIRQDSARRPLKSRSFDRAVEEYALADLIVVPSTFAYNSFIQEGIPQSKLAIVPYGVDIDSFIPTAERPRDCFRALFVGSFSLRKGAPYLLEAFRKFPYSQKRLSIVGTIEPDAEHMLDAVVRADDRIRIHGPLSKESVRSIMAQSHVLILPSIEDGFGLVMAEALACGCPVIATTNTGAQDLFTDGTEGFIVPIRDAEAIADRLERLAEDPHLHSDMSQAARARTESLEGWRHYGERMLEAYQRLTDA